MRLSLVFTSALPLLASLSTTLARPLRLDTDEYLKARSVAELDLDTRDAIATWNEMADQSYEYPVYRAALGARYTRWPGGGLPQAQASTVVTTPPTRTPRGGAKRSQRKAARASSRRGRLGKRSSGGGNPSGGGSNGGTKQPGMIAQTAATTNSVAVGSTIGHGISRLRAPGRK